MRTQISKCITRLLIASVITSLVVVPVAHAQTETTAPEPTPTSSFLDYSENEITMYEPNSNTGGACGGGASGGAGGDKLDGYELPAAKGKTGNEEAINASGQVGSTGGRVTFSGLLGKVPAAKRKAYQDYYITMRWTYAAWNWNGTAKIIDSKQSAWLGEKPRLVHVLNPRTKKAIIAVALEAGPAPWTGVDRQSNNTPKQGWTNPQKGTPSNYTGRVSGFPPVAIKALGAQQGMFDGSGDVLEYSWASDQNTTPGPVASGGAGGNSSTDDSADSTADTSGCANGDAGGNVNADGYTMPIRMAKNVLSNGSSWPCKETKPFCHHDETPAFDLAHTKTVKSAQDNLTTGSTVVAITDGIIVKIDPAYQGIAGCNSIQFQEKKKTNGKAWHYWYGHIVADSKLKAGDEVTAGQKIANVGPRKCTGNGSYPHLHIDRGSPIGATAGYVGSRDPGFVKLINKLYNEIPGGSQ